MSLGAQRTPPRDTKCPPAAQRKQANVGHWNCIATYYFVKSVISMKIIGGFWCVVPGCLFLGDNIVLRHTIRGQLHIRCTEFGVISFSDSA